GPPAGAATAHPRAPAEYAECGLDQTATHLGAIGPDDEHPAGPRAASCADRTQHASAEIPVTLGLVPSVRAQPGPHQRLTIGRRIGDDSLAVGEPAHSA